MATTSRTMIGPADHGRRMAFEEFVDAEFEEGYLYDLARGVIDVSGIPGIDHEGIVYLVNQLFIAYGLLHPGIIRYAGSGSGSRIRSPEMSSDRHPDYAVYLDPLPPDANRKNPWTQWSPTIVVEVVSEGGEHRDYAEKPEEYLRAGVQEYWILDPSDRTLHVYRRAGDAWAISILGADATYQTPLLPGLDVNPDQLLSPTI
jgi:Uma2 family endonuclease